ncbi:hypothetical protein E1H12_12665 [Geitlerinema sp. P-1104]|uniref:leucine-rich repeat domain-containing protein n=1 Tax=Geitlerinema sp. P-1104 TaxID=2546230 RepID=UPI001477715F|nr:leucine-rich repeat domain-containing protein [Geitlerinema sp. P-1104]NMG59344.1 hypothetical protein [Geitlerinema sp. P-1104]
MSEAEALRRIEQVKETGSTTLNLSGLGLTTLPSEVWDLQNLRWLYLNNNQLQEFSPQFGQLQNLEDLELNNNQLQEFPPQFGQLQNLRRLELNNNQLQEFPPQFGQLQNLEDLELNNNQLQELPAELGQLQNLRWLELNNNQLQDLPTELGQLKNLRWLYLNNNQLQDLPTELRQLKNLRRLYLNNNQLQDLPAELGKLKNLRRLYLNNNQLQDLPPQSGQLESLEELYLNNNQLEKFPPQLGKLKNLAELELNNNQLQEFPPQLGQLQRLLRLNVSHNQLRELPAEFAQLQSLKKLELSNNQLQEFPSELGKLKNLSELELNNNQLQELPAELGQLQRLLRLNVSHNQLRELPAEFAQLQSLEKLELSNNQLQELPAEFAQLQNLSRLNLNNNQLQKLPSQLGQLQNLSRLYLNKNQLQKLPAELVKVEGLHVLHLSRNQLEHLPEDFGKIERLHSLNLSYNKFKEIPNCLRNVSLDVLHIRGNPLDIKKPYLDHHEIKSYFETRDSVTESFSLAKRTSDTIKKVHDGEVKDFLGELIESTQKLYKSIVETIEELATNPNRLISSGVEHLKSYATSYILSHILVNDFLWAYLERLINDGLDYGRAKQEVDHLKKIHPHVTTEELCDVLVQNKFIAATGVEIQDQIDVQIRGVQYDFLAVTALLEEVVFQIGYCYGFEEFNWLEDIVVFAIVYNTQRLKRLGVDWVNSITSTSELSKLCISGFANFVTFQAIGYTAKFYYRFKRQGVKFHELLSRYEKLEESGSGVGALVEQHISQKAQVEQTLEMTVSATIDVLSYEDERKISESEQKPPQETPTNQGSTQPKETPQPSRLERSHNRKYKIVVAPKKKRININESCRFKAFRIDGDGKKVKKVKLKRVNWNCTEEGIISPDGTFVAKKGSDYIEVTAELDGVVGKAIVIADIPYNLVEKAKVKKDEQKGNTAKNDSPQRSKPKTESLSSSSYDEESSPASCLGSLVKWLVWVSIVFGGFAEPEVTWIEVLAGLSAFAWIVGLICPNVVINFGVLNTRESVSKLYSTLSVFFVGAAVAFNPESEISGNPFIDWLLCSYILMTLLVFVYPQGTILVDSENQQEEARSLGCGCLVLAFIVALLFNAVKAIFFAQ